jgi:hypothetical protein
VTWIMGLVIRTGFWACKPTATRTGADGLAAPHHQGSRIAEHGTTLARLGSRVFPITHEEAPVLSIRWAMSYLRGPMTRNQIKFLMDSHRASANISRPSRAPSAARVSSAPAAARVGRPASATAGTAPAPEPLAASASGSAEASRPASHASGMARPTLPPAVPQFFLPVRGSGDGLVYLPMVLGAARVRFTDLRSKVDVAQDTVLLTPIQDDAVPVDWVEAQEAGIDPTDLERDPASGAQFAPLPSAATQARIIRMAKDLIHFRQPAV